MSISWCRLYHARARFKSQKSGSELDTGGEFAPSLGYSRSSVICLNKGICSLFTALHQDGIFSLSTLLEEYPTYTSFVSQAFNSPTGQEFPTPFSSSTKKLLSDSSIESWSLATGQDQAPYFSRQNGTGQFPRVYFLHSKDDELLTFRQTLTGTKRMIKTIEENSNEKLSLQPVTFPKDGIAAVSEEEMSESRMLPSFVNVDLVSLKVSSVAERSRFSLSLLIYLLLFSTLMFLVSGISC